MENKLFTCDSWDENESLHFYEGEFIKDFGPIKEGERFAWISVDYGNGIMTFFQEDSCNNIELKVVE